jgi:hypothetical protein
MRTEPASRSQPGPPRAPPRSATRTQPTPRTPSRGLALALAITLVACGGEATDATDDTGTSTDATTTAATTTTPTDPSSSTTAATTGDGPYASLDERPCPDESPLTANNFGGPFMLSHCTGCHHSSLGEGERAGAPIGVDFDTLAAVRDQADRIWARAADQNATMPPLGGPADDERVRLGEWLACGAP